jgi:predicted metal-binding protein
MGSIIKRTIMGHCGDRMRRKVRKIDLEISREQLHEDLENYQHKAIAYNAIDAKIIKADTIPVDERVVLKCRIPICFGYDTSANCPPHTITPSELKNIIDKFNEAIVFKLEVNSKVIVRDRDTILERVDAYKKVFEIVSAIESAAFYDGYYLAVGFAAGSCKSTYCYKMDCTVLKNERCRRELKVRPSMEAVGIDAYQLASSVGWEVYPIGSDCDFRDVPKSSLLGLILIH